MSLHDRPSYPSFAEHDASKRGSAYGSDRALTTAQPDTASANVEKQAPATRAHSRTKLFVLMGLALLVVVVLAVILPIYFLVIKPNSNQSAGGGGGSGSTAGPGVVAGSQTRGGSGSTITLESGKTFTYTNNFGGFWVFDPNNPFDNSAQAQSYTPPLNQSWDYLNNQIFGVNIGGWLVLEPFITPALFQKYNVVDEWSLSVAMASDGAGGGLSQIEDHYKTFITEEDFAQIAAAGLNWVRIPLPFWAIEKYPNEPFLEKVSWQYFLKAISWARKYGLRINLDLHTLPGSQNGWNHSGKSGTVGMMNGVAGYMNAQRSLDYIRIITEFISQPQYKDVVPFFGIVNEAKISDTDTNAIPKTVMGTFYYEAHRMIREITGKGAGNGPMISIHDGFIGIGEWSGFMAGSDRIAMDSHPYFAFHDVNGNPISEFVSQACDWQPGFVNSRSQFGVTTAGEWSNAINDCGLFVNSAEPGTGTRYEGNYLGQSSTVFGSCSTWNDYTKWSDETKAGFGQLMLSSMDAFQNWFFWTWKIGPSLTSGLVEAPMWSYKLAIDLGFAPPDPRAGTGKCAALGKGTPAFTGPYQAWQTGGAGDTGQVVASEAALYGTWPPTTLGEGLVVAQLPAYTPTGAIPTLPVPTFSKPNSHDTFDAGNGWFDAQDTTPMAVPISGCNYPDQWNAVGIAIPPACSANTAAVPAPAAPGATPTVTAVRRWAHPAPTA